MGRSLGFFDNREELDRPDLNKCPDCQCFFSGDECPLCGKVCPEEMRAGNRKAVKPKKQKSSGSGRVTFIEWYHSWWFIVLMLFVFPIVGIVLLITSPHDKKKKIAFSAVLVVALLISTFGIGNLIRLTAIMLEKPVDTSLTREEYIASCESVTPEQFFRSSKNYEDKFVRIRLKVVCRADFVENFFYSDNSGYYICRAENNSDFYIIVRDCIVDSPRNLIAGDVITLCGEGSDFLTAYHGSDSYDAPSINMAYIIETE